GASPRLSAARDLLRAVLRRGPLVFDRPDQLLPQVHAHLAFLADSQRGDFARAIHHRSLERESSRAWLRLVMGPPADTALILRVQEGWVSSVAVGVDGRVASGGVDGAVRLWDPDSGDHRLLGRHGGAVWSVAVGVDGRVASGGFDGA